SATEEGRGLLRTPGPPLHLRVPRAPVGRSVRTRRSVPGLCGARSVRTSRSVPVRADQAPFSKVAPATNGNDPFKQPGVTCRRGGRAPGGAVVCPVDTARSGRRRRGEVNRPGFAGGSNL